MIRFEIRTALLCHVDNESLFKFLRKELDDFYHLVYSKYFLWLSYSESINKDEDINSMLQN